MRQEITYNKVVNIAEDGEITVLQYVFNYSDGFKGATGNKFYPVSKSSYEESISAEMCIEYLINSGMDVPDEYKRTGFKGMVEQMSENDRATLIYDMSYDELWDILRESANLSKDDAYIFECTSGGRMFNKDFQGNVNLELSAIIREYEA